MAQPNFFEVWGKESPETMQAFMDFAGKVQNQGGLDAKTFQLIYIALQAQNGAVGSVAGHTAFAKKAGATREEVRGAVLTTLMLGINGVADCLTAALEAYDNAPA
ncbi:alkylhydroperoxidase AhpD family core domain-containing protein [Sporobacter termitidis DSM 10068]|uniref:Alkylhydroperoxidase AhpD family core domain-containing protein n=1 Tax=Sporobacter termitidis DSM 10068 TaxID=1123282 RepID=A0A1M5ZEC4_9FIRM|nr:carboxymuconolactone decarboxylase family protein [Sporobacter termitidis]SHI22531.1 alkylhydroperoxidase AhpD family core domain-containing protein [Sporobacter termitidis DSM 10068]